MKKRILFAILTAIFFVGITHPLPALTQETPPVVKEKGVSSPSWMENGFDKPSESRFVHEFVKMLLALGFILVLIFVGAWVFKRLVSQKLYQANMSSSIKVVERRALSPKASVYLLDIEGRGVLIGETATEITRLAEFDLGEEKKSFGDIYDKTKANDE